MKNTNAALIKTLVVVATGVMASASAMAGHLGNVYETTTSLERFYAPGNGIEFGDQITLAGAERILTTFRFELFSEGLSGNEHVQVRLRENNGLGGAPNGILHDSGLIDIGGIAGGNNLVSLRDLSITVPDNFTWTVQFSGLDAGEKAGLVFYQPPTTGSSLGDFWQNNGGTWITQMLDGGATPANFGSAVVAVPEPSTMVLGLIAGLGMFGYMRRRSA